MDDNVLYLCLVCVLKDLPEFCCINDPSSALVEAVNVPIVIGLTALYDRCTALT